LFFVLMILYVNFEHCHTHCTYMLVKA